MTEKNKETIKELIKSIQMVLVNDENIPLDSAKKIMNYLKLILILVDKEK